MGDSIFEFCFADTKTKNCREEKKMEASEMVKKILDIAPHMFSKDRKNLGKFCHVHKKWLCRLPLLQIETI